MKLTKFNSSENMLSFLQLRKSDSDFFVVYQVLENDTSYDVEQKIKDLHFYFTGKCPSCQDSLNVTEYALYEGDLVKLIFVFCRLPYWLKSVFMRPFALGFLRMSRPFLEREFSNLNWTFEFKVNRNYPLSIKTARYFPWQKEDIFYE